MVNRYIEIFKNDIILNKQKLEADLERVMNDNITIDKKITQTKKIIKKINDISNVYTTFESYINNTKTEDNGNT